MALNIIRPSFETETNRIIYNTTKKENNTDKVLVILPTLNRPEKCKNAIQNILNQKYKNTYLLVIDDFSTEENYNNLKNYILLLNSEKIIFKRNHKNLKIAGTLNVGLNYFLENNYDYVSWISDDNKYYNNYISELLSQNSDFAYTSYIYNNIINNTSRIHDVKYTNYGNFINYFSGIMSFIWSKNAINIIGFYDETLYGAEDFDYLARTFKQKNIITIGYSNIPTMEYDRDVDSLYHREKQRIRGEFQNVRNKYKE